mmetsp:Transcript_29919/g.69186  ORF Transcript_29919/g.69186 Transcript_29919/m.69186 type:complete len:1476 (-) Transcript_29919:369-4796(-)|eukprot:CAMPEP_0114548560 /NCGR_PEP_ID=MMETSP0114-20121206/5049_1 /TAXON_ID=31324 /ORGANISM="Goniomonas sp, Strain m" /LENGTH=1475 /DNA_ID=CAMNT_0001733163 /DNA_START=78 /DNA_END=4505 /DNA_ORIENTATION=-
MTRVAPTPDLRIQPHAVPEAWGAFSGVNGSKAREPLVNGKGNGLVKHDMTLKAASISGGAIAAHSKSSQSAKVLDQHVEEETYIPLQVARRMLAEAENDMQTMKFEHVQVIEEMEMNFKQIEQETQQYFLKYIEKLNMAVETRSQQQRQALTEVTTGAQSYKDLAAETVESLKEKLATAEDVATQVKNKIAAEVEARRKYQEQLEDALADLQEEKEERQADLETAEEHLASVKQRLLDALQGEEGRHDATRTAMAEAAAVAAATVAELTSSVNEKTSRIAELEESLRRQGTQDELLLQETSEELKQVNQHLQETKDALAAALAEAPIKAAADVKAALASAEAKFLKECEAELARLTSQGAALAAIADRPDDMLEALKGGTGLLSAQLKFLETGEVPAAPEPPPAPFAVAEEEPPPAEEGAAPAAGDEAAAPPPPEGTAESSGAAEGTTEGNTAAGTTESTAGEGTAESNTAGEGTSAGDDVVRQSPVTTNSSRPPPFVEPTVALSKAAAVAELRVRLQAQDNIVAAVQALTATLQRAQQLAEEQAAAAAAAAAAAPVPLDESAVAAAAAKLVAEGKVERVGEKMTAEEEVAALKQRLHVLQQALREHGSGAHGPCEGVDAVAGADEIAAPSDDEIPEAGFEREPEMPLPADASSDLVAYAASLREAHARELSKLEAAAKAESSALRTRLLEVTLEHEEAIAGIRSAAEETSAELETARAEVEELLDELQQLRDGSLEIQEQLREENNELYNKNLGLEEDLRRIELSNADIARQNMEAELAQAREERSRLEAEIKAAEEAKAGRLSELQAAINESEVTMREKQRLVAELHEEEGKLRAKEAEAALRLAEKAKQQEELLAKLEAEKEAAAKDAETRKAAADTRKQAVETKQIELAKAIDRTPKRLALGTRLAAAGGAEAVAARRSAAAAASKGAGGADPAVVKALEKQLADAQKKVKQLEDKVAKGGSGGASGPGGNKATEKKLATREKELARAQEIKAKTQASLDKITEDFNALQKENKKLTAQVELGGQAAQELAKQQAALEQLQQKTDTLEAECKTLKDDQTRLEADYRKEVTLRKRYYNIIEDMKGKIRVYCRCRPQNKREKDLKCKDAVRFPDEMTIEVQTAKDVKSFTFDECFQPGGAQAAVCEPTLHLVQSAVDGYNVCIFAYGQTGSGKTHTMYGPPQDPGVAPRAMQELYAIREREAGSLEIVVTCYMLELYNDQLVDLLCDKLPAADKKEKKEELKIKQDAKGIVFVQGATIRTAETFEELQKWNTFGFDQRHVASTAMNAESSRSHLIFSVLVSTTNKATGTKTLGKLTLVDLAGSERVGKTGATADRLKEATSINKSLSALGDVISALSSTDKDKPKHIPYRNNKLTMLLQDGLGGNAKTLMFVNISPADNNADETQTSLLYASRVKLITNSAEKEKESKEISRLKAIIEKLKAGGVPVELDEDRPPTPPQPDASVKEGELVDGY